MFQAAFIPFNDQYDSISRNQLVPFSLNMIRPTPIKLVFFTHRHLTLFNHQVKNACQQKHIELVVIFSDQHDLESEHYRDQYDDHIYPVLHLETSSGDQLSRKGALSSKSLHAFLKFGD